MSEEESEVEGAQQGSGPSTQQEVNLAIMEAIRHLAEYSVEVNKLAAVGAGYAAGVARANGDEDAATEVMDQVDNTRKAGLRYHNAAMDLWEAFQKDAGDELVKPRPVTRVPIDD